MDLREHGGGGVGQYFSVRKDFKIIAVSIASVLVFAVVWTRFIRASDFRNEFHVTRKKNPNKTSEHSSN